VVVPAPQIELIHGVSDSYAFTCPLCDTRSRYMLTASVAALLSASGASWVDKAPEREQALPAITPIDVDDFAALLDDVDHVAALLGD